MRDFSIVKKFPGALVLLICAASLVAQDAPAASISPRPGRHARGVPPCVQQAGIDKSVMEQLISAKRDMRSQVEGVCSNTSLSAEQKHQQLREIHQQTRQKIEGLITPEQEKELVACRQHMHGGNHPGGSSDLFGGGGCRGGMYAGGRPGYNGQRPGNRTSSTPSPVSQSTPQD